MAVREAYELGTLHILTNTNRCTTYLTNGSLATGGSADIDCSGYIPKGAKGVLVTIMCQQNVVGAFSLLSPIGKLQTPQATVYQRYMTVWNTEEGRSGYQSCSFAVAVDADGKFKIYNTNSMSASSAYYISLAGYYI